MSSLEALESCFAVGPVNEKASNFLNTFLSFQSWGREGQDQQHLLQPWGPDTEESRIRFAQSADLKVDLAKSI